MPRRLTSSMSRCSATSTHTGTAAELAGKPEYLCPALFTGRTTRLFVNS
jgi:hypothetical protein